MLKIEDGCVQCDLFVDLIYRVMGDQNGSCWFLYVSAGLHVLINHSFFFLKESWKFLKGIDGG